MGSNNKMRCPICGYVLQFRKKRNGWVCKMWRCPNYVKYNYGNKVWTSENPPPAISYKVGQVIPVTYLFELITGEIIKLSNTKARVKYKYKNKIERRTVGFLTIRDWQKWHNDEKSNPDSYFNRLARAKLDL